MVTVCVHVFAFRVLVCVRGVFICVFFSVLAHVHVCVLVVRGHVSSKNLERAF